MVFDKVTLADSTIIDLAIREQLETLLAIMYVFLLKFTTKLRELYFTDSHNQKYFDKALFWKVHSKVMFEDP